MLVLRRLGPADGWFVIAGTSEGVSITSPESGATVSAGMLAVEGLGRGFESNLIVRAIVVGNSEEVLDLDFTNINAIPIDRYIRGCIQPVFQNNERG